MACLPPGILQISCSCDVNLLGEHLTVSTRDTTIHFHRKNKNGCELAKICNIGKSYAYMKKALLKNSCKTRVQHL